MEISMKKRLLCLFLVLVTVLSMVLTACSSGDEEEVDVEEDMGAQTITMRIISDKKVCNTEAEFAAYCKELKDSGLKEDSKEYKDAVAEMEKTMEAYEAVEYAFSKLTKSKYKINVDLMFYTEEDYQKSMSATMDQYALETKKIARAEKALSKYIADYQEWWNEAYPGQEFPTDLVKADFYTRFPEYEEYKDKSSAENEDIYFEEQYKENEDGIQELVYPEAEAHQLDIIYISGQDMYNEYIEKEWIIDLNSLISTTGKKLNDYITGALLNGVKKDGMTYAIPNNVQIGNYTYMLVDKELYSTYYGTDPEKISNVLDLGVFLRDIAENENDYTDPSKNIIPIDSSFDECINQFVWYWNIEREILADEDGNAILGEVDIYNEKTGELVKTEHVTVTTGYKNGNGNKFALLGALYNDPASAGRGQIELGFNALFADERYREIFTTLKGYEYNGYFAKADDERDASKAAVRFMEADYAVKQKADENGGVYKDANGREYYVYIVKNPEVGEKELYGNMFAISANSVRTQACMQILTLINTNAEARNILQYGVEGVNYTVDEIEKNGEKEYVVKRLNKDYMMSIEKTGNCFIAYPDPDDKEMFPAGSNMTMAYWENAKKQNNDALINPLLGFDFDTELGRQELYEMETDDILATFTNYKDLDHGQLSCMDSAAELILEKINACTSLDELNAYIDESLLSKTAVESYNNAGSDAEKAALLSSIKAFGGLGITSTTFDYIDEDGDLVEGGIIMLSKMIDKTYSTAPTEENKKGDTDGESPYAIYYQWLLTNGYQVGVLTE